MTKMRDIGDRMKENYEDRQRFYLTRRTPVIVRVDGQAFHTFTRGFKRPFDERLLTSMIAGAEVVFQAMQGCKLAYIQSDEASFVLTDYDNLTTEAWFDYNKSKIETISASAMTAAFNAILGSFGCTRELATFDARAFNIPASEVVNYFLWRAKDWYRNSVMMYAQSVFSHQELQNKSVQAVHEMLHSKRKNWAADLSHTLKNGTFLVSNGRNCGRIDFIEPHYNDIDQLWQAVKPEDD
jgi:tRNA(His) 5'-end guanylyltransferase